GDAPGRRLPPEGDPGGHGRSVARRRRPRAGPAGGLAGRAGSDDHDRGRALRRADGGADRPAAAAVSAPRRVRVAVLMGGRSSEHEISLASARSVLAELDPERYEVVTIKIGRDGGWQLGTGTEPPALPAGSAEAALPVPLAQAPVAQTLAEVDVVIPVLHGPLGEDGTVQGLLELAGVPYVGAGV